MTLADLLFVCLGAALYYCEQQQIETVAGFWLIFTPFAPCSLWAAVMLHWSRVTRAAVDNNKKFS